MKRVVEPEILDTLQGDDPAARRGRRDLRLVNLLMGNERWLARAVAKEPAAARGVVELGAGDGRLAAVLARRFPVTAIDLAGRPPGLPEVVEWRRGDVFDLLGGTPGGVVVANLFIHHFAAGALGELGRGLRRFEVVCLSEPWRVALATWLGRACHPLIGPVTRHDMHVSIRAGFRRGELAGLLGLDGGNWSWRERTDLRGAIRLVARRVR